MNKFLAILFFIVGFILILLPIIFSLNGQFDLFSIFIFGVFVLTGIFSFLQGDLFWNNKKNKIITFTLIILGIIVFIIFLAFLGLVFLLASGGFSFMPGG